MLDHHEYLRSLRQPLGCRKPQINAIKYCGPILHIVLIYGTHDDLSSKTTHPFRPYDSSWAIIEPYKTRSPLPAGRCEALLTSHPPLADCRKTHTRSSGSLGSATANPSLLFCPLLFLIIHCAEPLFAI